MWIISKEECSKYEVIFNQLSPLNGKLDGEKCKPVMMKSQLSTESLGRIWDLSDIDNDGNLDKVEFILAMHLIHRCVEGDMLPDTLPRNLIPPGKEQYFSQLSFSSPTMDPFLTNNAPASLALVPLPQTSASQADPLTSLTLAIPPTDDGLRPGPSSWSQFSAHSQVYSFPPWAISAEEYTKASRVFAAIDLDADGLVSGPEVRDVLIRSGLQQSILAQIWELVDIQCMGMLNCEQFAVAMRLATDQLASSPYSRSLPAVLPPALVPPSLRPIPPDPSLFEESNKLIAEIQALNRERAEVEAAYTTLTVESQRRATETLTMQRTVEALNHTSRSLVSQRNEAERRLADYAHERDALEGILKELKGHVVSEKQKVEEIRNQVNTQQVSAKSQEEEITRLRTELNELIREEALLQDRVAASRRRLEVIETENRVTQTRIEKATKQFTTLERTRGQLLQVLDQYDSLLNGDTSVPEPDEAKVMALLADESLDNDVTAFDTGVGGTGSTRFATYGFTDSEWSGNGGLLSRKLGAASVPLPVMSANRLGGSPDSKASRQQPVSSLGLPITSDLFHTGPDPFSSDGLSKPVPSVDKGPLEDPFGPTNLFSNSDPFKDIDPFGCDPFSLPSDKPKENQTNAVSAFDPFAPPANRPKVAQNSLTGADFDAVFGPSATGGDLDDPFGGDPFTNLEQLAAISGNTTSQSAGTKKSPPPRPKTQPGAGKASKLSDDPSGKNTGLKSLHSVDNFPDVDHPGTLHKFTSLTSPRGQKHGFGHLSHKPGFISRVRNSSKSKKDMDNKADLLNSNSSSKTPEANVEWTPPNLTEEEQLSLATLESQRLAQVEERARQQEEADLELAIRLSKMDSLTS
ncbi:unnamed protein product [Calicophoron daubneyi]|uniref:Epidermal growth factor receptor substrate 15-like 1 n=1 Tax=Calicophoron daubneyi TaxID=300641 RepID=A0AAV2T9W9_CALDB